MDSIHEIQFSQLGYLNNLIEYALGQISHDVAIENNGRIKNIEKNKF